MNGNVRHKQVKTQFNSYVRAHYQGAASCPINGKHNIPVAFEGRKCLTLRTFSQKLYQTHEQKIAEEFDQAIDANSLEKIHNLFDKVLEISEIRVIG